MPRSRILFILIIGVAVLVTAGLLALQAMQRNDELAEATRASLNATQVAYATATALAAPRELGNVVPIYAGGSQPTDNLPRYVCAADAFGSYYALQQMQVAGYDVQNGFRLGLVPFFLPNSNGAYDYSEEARSELLETGKIDCLFTTLDSVALKGQGIITAIVDESAGADQLWVRPPVKTLNDLRGKKVIFVSGSVSQFFVFYALAAAGLNPRTDVQMVPVDGMEEAIQLFNANPNEGGMAISGWEPNIADAAKSGAGYLIGSDRLHVIVDVIMTSRQSIKNKLNLVQRFHDAWFQTLKAQFENFPAAAKQVADWGYNDWSGIETASAEKDLGTQLAKIAQAGLSQNVTVMTDKTPLAQRLEAAQRVWAASGQTPFSGQAATLIDTQFVLNSSKRTELRTSAQPRNTSFLLASRPDFKEIGATEGETLAVLPCRKFDFYPESIVLTQEAIRSLDACVFPILQSSTGLYLRVKGSAAWPKNDPPTPLYTEKDILDVAQARAQAVVDYLVKNGLDRRRFNVSAVVPPAERRNLGDGLDQSVDRYVELTLITVGR